MAPRPVKVIGYTALAVVIVYSVVLSFPLVLSLKIQHDEARARAALVDQFPVTVDPRSKRIVEDVLVNEYLSSADSPFQAAIGNTGALVWQLFEEFATTIASLPLYPSLASAEGRFVKISPGFRKEQVANSFASVLGWTAKQRQQFLASATSTVALLSQLSSSPLTDGIFSPGVYVVAKGTTPEAARALVDERFSQEILARYGSEVAEVVPLDQALTIASLIQKEAAGPSDMRIISGIIWNRLFINMKLQIDATVQYAQANAQAGGNWWPQPRPGDMAIRSPYNTYVHKGLPPGPISNPSVASVLAALNPVVTDCLFYFHDRLGGFHCSPDYKGHVALLKQHYGRGK